MYILISLILISYYIYLKIVYSGLTFSIFFVFVAIGLIIYNLIKDDIVNSFKELSFDQSLVP